MKQKIICLLLIFVMLLSLTGCDNEEKQKGEYQIYYLNMDRTKLVAEEYNSTGVTGEALAWELLTCLQSAPDSSKLRQAIPSDVQILGIKSDGSYLSVDFSEMYKNMSVTEEVLTRAAIVRTLCQIPEYRLISFTINAEPLRTTDGTLVGNMSTDSFVENQMNKEN